MSEKLRNLARRLRSLYAVMLPKKSILNRWRDIIRSETFMNRKCYISWIWLWMTGWKIHRLNNPIEKFHALSNSVHTIKLDSVLHKLTEMFRGQTEWMSSVIFIIGAMRKDFETVKLETEFLNYKWSDFLNMKCISHYFNHRRGMILSVVTNEELIVLFFLSSFPTCKTPSIPPNKYHFSKNYLTFFLHSIVFSYCNSSTS